MKYYTLTLLIFVFLAACNDSENNKEVDLSRSDSQKQIDSDTAKIYPKAGRLSYNRVEWRVKSSNYADSPGLCLSDEKNIYKVGDDKLYMSFSDQSGEWSGSEMVASENFGRGFFKFTIALNVKDLSRNLALSLISLNAESGAISGIAQMGVRFTFNPDEEDVSPLEFFLYSTDSKIEEVYSAKSTLKEIADTVTVVYGMSGSEIVFACYNGSNTSSGNMIEELRLSEYSNNNTTMPDDIRYAQPAELQKPAVNFCLADSYASFDEKEMSIIILDFDFIPSDDNLAFAY